MMNGPLSALSTLRLFAKNGIACALHWTGMDRGIGALTRGAAIPLILSYHRVVDHITAEIDRGLPAMVVSTRTLEQQLDWVGRRFHYLSLDELGRRLESGEPFRRPVAAVTFDDGYRDVYNHAVPLLVRKGIPAAVFVVTDLVGTPRLQLHDHLYLLLVRACAVWRRSPRELAPLFAALKIEPAGLNGRLLDPYLAVRTLLHVLPQAGLRCLIDAIQENVRLNERALAPVYSSMDWDMLADMRRRGFTIGSHSKTHAILTNESYETMLEEVAESRRVLQERLGTDIVHFAYPDGRFNRVTLKALSASGYRFAYTACWHRDAHAPLLTVPRLFLTERSCAGALGRFSPALMSCHARGVSSAGMRCSQDHHTA